MAAHTLEISTALQDIDDACKERVRKIRSKHDLEKKKNLSPREQKNTKNDHLESCVKTSEEHGSNDAE